MLNINPTTSTRSPNEDLLVIKESKDKTKITAEEKNKLNSQQPLPGSRLTNRELWKMVMTAMQMILGTLSNMAADQMKNKKALIKYEFKKNKDLIEKRMEKAQKAADAKKNTSIWQTIGMVFSYIAAAITMVFNPVLGAVLLAVTIAMQFGMKHLEKALAKIMPPNIAAIVTMSIEVLITVIMCVVSFNPSGVAGIGAKISAAGAKMAAKAGSMAAKLAPKAAAMAGKVASKATSIGSKVSAKMAALSEKMTAMASKLPKVAGKGFQKVKKFANIDTLSKVSSGASAIATITTAGISIDATVKVAKIEKKEADLEALIEMLKTILSLINNGPAAAANAAEAVHKVQSDFREYMSSMMHALA